MSADRRQHTRVPASLPCALISDGGQEEAFELIDLSEAGARLRLKRGISAMTRVGVILELPADRIDRPKDARIRTTGVVVWSHRGEGDYYDIGVFFPELPEQDRDMLLAFVLSAPA